MPARMVGSPVQMVYSTRKADNPTKGFPTYEDPPVDYKDKVNGILPGYAGVYVVRQRGVRTAWSRGVWHVRDSSLLIPRPLAPGRSPPPFAGEDWQVAGRRRAKVC